MADLYCGGVATPCLLTVNAVDECTGAYLTGGPYGYVFDGVRSVEWEPVLNEGQSAQFVDNCGVVVCDAETQDQLLGHDITLEKCALPSELVSLLTGQPVIVNGGGDAIGWYHDDSVSIPPVALRIWSKTLGCTAAAKWAVRVFPFVRFSFPTPGVEGDLIQFNTLTAKARKIPSSYDSYGIGAFGEDAELGWVGNTARGAFGEYFTDDDPLTADCALVAIPAP